MQLTAPNTKFNCKLKPTVNHFDAYSSLKLINSANTHINPGLSTIQVSTLSARYKNWLLLQVKYGSCTYANHRLLWFTFRADKPIIMATIHLI